MATTPSPIIAFGQQPCGFFPKRYLAAKVLTARRMQRELGGEIVFFYHDSDHDPRETKTTLRHRQSGKMLDYNFEYENKVQRKYSPLYVKRIPAEWHRRMVNALPNYVGEELVEAFRSTLATNVGDFCLEMYRKMGLLDGLRVVRSSERGVREAACEVADYFVDVPYENEVVRARYLPAGGENPKAMLQLHEGGTHYITWPAPREMGKAQISPSRDTRLRWMQSVIHCTHYITGGGEQQYLRKEEVPEVQYVVREEIERMEEAWTEGGGT
jgi:hypothetical protein